MGTGSGSLEDALALAPGSRLRDFEIVKLLGHGGFGITYLARDTRDGQSVAVKEYLPGHLAVRASNSTVVARTPADNQTFQRGIKDFLEEGRRVATLSHINIMQVKQFFFVNGTGYIVLGYENGQTLKERLAAGTLPEKALRTLLEGVLNGLIVVHGKGLVHRDIKPSNIILSRSRSRDGEVPVLIDFGATREFADHPGKAMTALITPGYSPQEQYRSGGQGPRSDLYALGATAYHCIAGAPPLESTRRTANDLMVPAAICGKGRYANDLLRLVDWMLRLDEAARPSSAAEALTALKAVNGETPRPAGTPIAAKPDLDAHARAAAAPAAAIQVHADDDKRAVLVLQQAENVDLLELALLVDPPGRYLAEKAGFQDSPCYFAFDQVVGENGAVGYRSRAGLQSRIAPRADVAFSSRDGVVRGRVAWLGTVRQQRSSADGALRTTMMAGLILLLSAFVAAATNIGRIQDGICTRFDFCTAQQKLLNDAAACIERSPKCSIEACAVGFRRTPTSPRMAERFAGLEAQARDSCRSADSASFAEAKSCARQSEPCAAGRCFGDYLANYPNGLSVAAVREEEARSRQLCASVAPPAGQMPTQGAPAGTAQAPSAQPAAATPQSSTQRPSDPARAAAPPSPQIALPDGLYDAERRYTGTKSRTDPINCPPQQPLKVEVRGDVVTFEVTEGAGGITRKWKGRILDPQTGAISFLGQNAEPPLITRYTILGGYASAVIDSVFCGSGVFSVLK